MSPALLETVNAEFTLAAEKLFIDSPLYRRLCGQVAGDEFLLELAAHAQPGQSAVLMLLGAVHYLTLRGARHPLREWYALAARGITPTEDPWPLFRDFCMVYVDQIRSFIATGRVQTNEVGRSMYLRLGMEWLALQRPIEAVSWVELGASSGLNLLWDRFCMEFIVDGGRCVRGDPDSSVRLRCTLSGSRTPLERPVELPPIRERIGIEIDPIDLRGPGEIDRLLAFVWADHGERLHRLRLAAGLFRIANLRVRAADAVKDMPAICAGLRPDTLLCLAHTFFTSQLPAETNGALLLAIAAVSANRPVARIGVEWIDDQTQMFAEWWEQGKLTERTRLATGHPHGNWVQWIEQPLPHG